MKILFMCVANSARSQMAEGLAKNLWPSTVQVESAGSAPTRVNPHAHAVMAEIGIDLSSHRSKTFEQLPADFVNDLDYVVTLCAEEVCPHAKTNAKRLHWPFPDPADPSLPAEEQLNNFRQVRDGLSSALKSFAVGASH